MPPKRTIGPRSLRLGSLGSAIEHFRVKANLNQGELADKSELHVTHVSGLERGARNPTFETISDISAAMNISAAQLVSKADKIYKSYPESTRLKEERARARKRRAKKKVREAGS
jgi:transcriptional regulator with XRE-family HTH domain